MATVFHLQSEAPTSRRHRRPKHKFQLRQKPFQLQPFMIAPVLPAETLQSWYFEAREVSDPIKSPIVGWASEWWAFYVKIRDLDERDQLDELFIDPVGAVTALNEGPSVPYYHRGGSPNYTKLALKRIVETYFRDAGESWNNADIDGMPSVQYRDLGWLDSVTDDTVMPVGDGDPSGATTPEALDKMMDAYEYLRAMSLIDMDFEAYLRTFGVQISKAESHQPELIANWKEFQYPSNTIDPATGSPSSAISWVFKKMGRDKKFFREPGFVLGVHAVRPKLYMNRQFGSLTHHLDNGLSWLPAVMKDSPETSLRQFTGGAAGNGPLSSGSVGPTNGYWVDMRDLWLYGDQFLNFALNEANANLAAIPADNLRKKYVTLNDVEGLFSGDNKLIRSDGFLSLDVLGSQVDFTPTTGATA